MKRLALTVLLFSGLMAQQPTSTMLMHKAAHFTIGFGIGWGGQVSGHPKTGLALGIGLGIAKEVHDVHYGETMAHARRDVIVTSLGTLAGYLVARHYYPDGADLSGGHESLTLYQQEQEDIRLQAEFKALDTRKPEPTLN